MTLVGQSILVNIDRHNFSEEAVGVVSQVVRDPSGWSASHRGEQ